jgi:hypothetical protein
MGYRHLSNECKKHRLVSAAENMNDHACEGLLQTDDENNEIKEVSVGFQTKGSANWL